MRAPWEFSPEFVQAARERWPTFVRDAVKCRGTPTEKVATATLNILWAGWRISNPRG